MRRIGARSLLAMVFALLASCAGATAKPEQAPVPRSEAAPVAASRYIPVQRDLYTQELVYLLRHGWRTPEDLDAAPMSLRTMVELSVDAHGSFMRYRVTRSSGNESFDSSVADHVQGLIDSGARVEQGPPYVVDRVSGELITVLFLGPPPPGTPPY